ncbi:hypothetical protein [Phytohabitans suffuscus]|uniref:Cytotoxic translational repressor of toxin-antitoxin stability system n=1 Tax=Phytohabitans suffuscus TaxID=624315 RepID=A0A6F8YBW1_9ACTN|nr:hypothetical protein [Phytohabitans suffuscus]BCB83557.1 hypothetical protein Psuf_008700 [Phytohabitans suffuscus]
MSPKRGDRVAPPARPGEYHLRFATADAAKGWEDLCRQAPANTRTAFESIRADPVPFPATERHHRLKHDLGVGRHDGRAMEQWQYEVTGAGRVWYLVDRKARTVWLTYAGTAHPRPTDR